MKNKHTIKIVAAGCVLLGFLIGVGMVYFLGYRPQPRNCSELAVAYLEMGKKYYGIGSDDAAWNLAIDKETEIHKICMTQFPKQYPWDAE